MLDYRTHSVENPIISLFQPYLRRFARGKIKALVEFAAKLDISVRAGLNRMEKLSVEAHNASIEL